MKLCLNKSTLCEIYRVFRDYATINTPAGTRREYSAAAQIQIHYILKGLLGQFERYYGETFWDKMMVARDREKQR